ncbi:MAG: flagellin lysine-N-methylase [Clostridia bacterium]|nr:flagellin lysine-N-methylase [Clostridia bacterium]
MNLTRVYPNYYEKFTCIKGECRHNCCIGWEIDIDKSTAARYRKIKGDLGKRLKKNIAWGRFPHFKNCADGRCPFLNTDNLCDIIIGIGDNALCDICDRHPRFFNELPDRIEVGLGLSCEAAGRIILGESEPVRLLNAPPSTEDELINLRDNLIVILQDRSTPIEQRMDRLLKTVNCQRKISLSSLVKLLKSLEVLDNSWLQLLENYKPQDIAVFLDYMGDRAIEYEQLAVYFIYRHFAIAPSREQVSARALFAVLSVRLLMALGSMLWWQNGQFTFEDQVELARMYSAEIEYSDQNLYIILNSL